MVFFTDVHDAPEPTAIANGIAADTVLAEVQASSPGWIPVQGALVNVLLDLTQHPEVTLVRVGETKDSIPQPLYLARAAHEGNVYLGVCGFHLPGAQIAAGGIDMIAPRYEVLTGKTNEFDWQDVREGFDRSSPVRGAFLKRTPPQVELEPHFICRYHVGEMLIHGSANISGDTHIPLSHRDSATGVGEYEILVRSASGSVKLSPQTSEDGTLFSTGICSMWTTNWQDVKPGTRRSKTVHLDGPLRSAPRIITGFDGLDMGNHDSAIRLWLYTQNVTKDKFMFNVDSWGNTYLYGCGTTWAAIAEPTWQCGVLKKAEAGDLWRNRIDFSPPFSSPPMVLACLCGLDMVGESYVRLLVTEVDHAGCNISILKPGDVTGGVTFVSWIAIPGHEVFQRNSSWIGRFSTDSLSPEPGKEGVWTGSVKFGFEFKREPKVFLGVDHFNCSKAANIRLGVSISEVSTSGMNWRIGKWGDTVLKGVGVSFLAVDTI